MKQDDSQQSVMNAVWIQEMIQFLSISAAQMEKGMQTGETEMAVLTESFLTMTEDLQELSGQLLLLQDSEPVPQALRLCTSAKDNSQAAVTALQHYDRLRQRLEHVLLGLQNMLQLLQRPEDCQRSGAWKKLREEIRSRYTMESEKIVFDAILQGKSVAQAIELAGSQEQADSTSNDIELF